jgi:hypothetical protein
MLERAKCLLQPSTRGAAAVLVMDVSRRQRAEAQAGASSIELGHRRGRRAGWQIAAARTAPPRARLGYTETLDRCSAASPRLRRMARPRSDPARIVVTTGSSAASLAFLAAFEAGDRVATALPGYPPYRHILAALGCEPVGIETTASARWSLTGEALLALHRARELKGIILASPANPTGTMMTAAALAELIRCAQEAGIAVISDEIYHGLDYAFAAETAARFSPDAIVVNSFSKYFCMTGWRIGWMVVPPALVRTVERLQQNLAISVPTLSQIAVAPSTDALRPGGVRHGYRDNGASCSTDCPAPGSTRFFPPTAHSIFTPTCRDSRTTASPSRRVCSRRGAWRRRRESTSTPCTARTSCACAMPGPARRCEKPSDGSAIGCARALFERGGR